MMILLVLCGIWQGGAGIASSQDDTPRQSVQTQPVSPGTVASPPPIELVGPPLYYFKDRDGNPIPVPDISYEELIRLIDIDRGLVRRPPSPDFVLQSISVEGAVEESSKDIAQLDVIIKIRLKRSGMFAVPLQLDGLSVTGKAYDGPGSFFLSNTDTGYVGWIQGDADSLHTVEVQGVAAVHNLRDESRMVLRVPPAVSSNLKLRVPLRTVAANTTGGASLLQPLPVETNQSLLTAVGLKGRFELVWRPQQSAPKVAPGIVEVTGTLNVVVAGPNRVRTQVQLLLRKQSGIIESFRARLPVGASLVPQAYPGYSIMPMSEENGPLVEVSVFEPADEVSVSFETLFDHPPDETHIPLEVGQFEVLGALRQSGRISLSAEGPWSLYWKEGPSVVRTPELDEVNADKLSGNATFEYYQQPCALNVTVKKKKSRVHVEPQFVVFLGKNIIRSTAILRYNVRGMPVDFVKLDIPEWLVQDVRAEGLDGSTILNFDENPELVVRFSEAQIGQFQIEVESIRLRESPESKLSVLIPRPLDSIVAPTTVVLLPEHGMQVTPLLHEMRELASLRDATVDVAVDISDANEALFFRDLGGTELPRLVADCTIRPLQIAVSSRTHLRVDLSAIGIRQSFAYEIEFGSVDYLDVLIPDSLAELENWTATLDDELVASEVVHIDSPTETGVVLNLLRVALPKPVRDRCTLEVSCTVPTDSLREQDDAVVTIPLTKPFQMTGTQSQSNQRDHRVYVSKSRDVMVSPNSDASWKMESAAGSGAPDQLVITTELPTRTVKLRVVPSPRSGIRTTVHKTFIQTWLLSRRRHDRAVFQLSTTEDAIRFRLPPAVDPQSIELELNAKPQAVEFADRHLYVRVAPSEPEVARHIVDMTYGLTNRPAPGRYELDQPIVVDSQWVDRTFWQLNLPHGEKLLSVSDNLISENAWRQRGLLLHRATNYSDAELNSWVGTGERRITSPAMSSHLFSSVGSIDSVGIRTTRRTTLVATCSGIVLLTGFALIYVPALRHPGFFLAAAVLLFGAGFFAPQLAGVLGHASELGVFLVILSLVLNWIMRRKYRTRPIVRGQTSKSVDSRTTDLLAETNERSSPGSSKTQSAIALSSSVHSK